MTQMFPQQAKILPKFPEVAPQAAQILDDLFGPLFNLHAFKPRTMAWRYA